MSLGANNRMFKRAVKEIQSGMTVNLGIGLPTKVIDYLDPSIPVCMHSENGIAGVGPAVNHDRANRNLIDAGGGYVSIIPGTTFFDSAESFALVRSGRLNLTMMGAFQVASNGDLANWAVPGKFIPGLGGAAELAQKAQRVVILTAHTDKWGVSKIVEQCSLPLTAAKCVDRIYTDLAVIDIVDGALVLKEISEDTCVEEVISATGADLQINEKELLRF